MTTHELTYPGIVNPAPGTQMGPGLDGHVWSVVGAMYDTDAHKTTVTLEELT